MKNKLQKIFIGLVNWLDSILDTWQHEPKPSRTADIYSTI